jgi:hypothetical protein
MKKKVYIADNPTDAHFVKGLLDAQEIVAEIREEGMIGDYPSLWVSSGLDFELAQQVISAISCQQATVATAGEPWSCLRCGESVEPQFTDCWRCGTRQPIA